MGNFSDHNITYHIEVTDITICNKIKSCLSKLGLSYIDSSTENARVCILDASLYFSNKLHCDKNYEICLKILSVEDCLHYYEGLFDGIGFALRADFTTYELEKSILFIQKYINYQNQNQILQTVFNSANNSVVITNTEGVIQYANQYFLKATGYKNEDVLGGLPRLIRSGFHNNSFYQELWNTISSGLVWNGFFVNQRKNGRLFYEEATISPISNSLGQIENYLKIGKLVEREHLLSNELTQEMKNAREVMAYILPADYSDKNINFKSKVKAYNYLGGDYICFEKITDSKYAVGIIDVIGHGMSSSIIGMKAISVFQSVIYYDNLENSVKKVNEAINLINEFDISTVRYLSGVFMMIDIEGKTISYVNAGHPAFYGKAQNKLLKFESNNMILGIVNQKTFLVESISLEHLSYLFLYSDGLIENDKEGLEVSEYNLEQALEDAESSEQSFMDSVINKMIGNGEYSDDITLCYIELI